MEPCGWLVLFCGNRSPPKMVYDCFCAGKKRSQQRAPQKTTNIQNPENCKRVPSQPTKNKKQEKQQDTSQICVTPTKKDLEAGKATRHISNLCYPNQKRTRRKKSNKTHPKSVLPPTKKRQDARKATRHIPNLCYPQPKK